MVMEYLVVIGFMVAVAYVAGYMGGTARAVEVCFVLVTHRLKRDLHEHNMKFSQSLARRAWAKGDNQAGAMAQALSLENQNLMREANAKYNRACEKYPKFAKALEAAESKRKRKPPGPPAAV